MTQDPEQSTGEPVEQQGQPGGEPQDAAPQPGPDAGPEAQGLEEELQDDTGSLRSPEGSEGSPDADDAARQLSERTADLQRLQAEYVNYKRRVDRDRELVRENATYTVLSSLLPVLDDIDRAREHGEVTGGFKAVADSLDRVVGGLGLVKFGEVGEEFDPNLHEALMHRPDEEATTTSVENVAQAGYRIGDRVVRAARVTVAGPA